MSDVNYARRRAIHDLAARRVAAMSEDERLAILIGYFTELFETLTDEEILVELYPRHTTQKDQP